jgi:hypothetical protein
MTSWHRPKNPMAFCSRTVKQVMFRVPELGDVCVGVSILSKPGTCCSASPPVRRCAPTPKPLSSAMRPSSTSCRGWC